MTVFETITFIYFFHRFYYNWSIINGGQRYFTIDKNYSVSGVTHVYRTYGIKSHGRVVVNTLLISAIYYNQIIRIIYSSCVSRVPTREGKSQNRRFVIDLTSWKSNRDFIIDIIIRHLFGDRLCLLSLLKWFSIIKTYHVR